MTGGQHRREILLSEICKRKGLTRYRAVLVHRHHEELTDDLLPEAVGYQTVEGIPGRAPFEGAKLGCQGLVLAKAGIQAGQVVMDGRMQVVHNLELRPLAVTSAVLTAGACDGIHDGFLVGRQLEVVIELWLRLVGHIEEDAVKHLVVPELDIIVIQLDRVIVSSDIVSGFQQMEHLVVEGGVTSEDGRMLLDHIFALHSCGLFHDGSLFAVVNSSGEDIHEPRVDIVASDGLFVDFLFLIRAEDLRDAASVTEGLMDLNFLVHEQFEDTEVVLNVLIGCLLDEVMDVRGLLLAVTVDTAVALLKGDERPGKVVVEHPVAEVVQVHTLRTGIRADEQPNSAILFGEVLD